MTSPAMPAQPVRLSSTMPSSQGTLPSLQPPSIALLARLASHTPSVIPPQATSSSPPSTAIPSMLPSLTAVQSLVLPMSPSRTYMLQPPACAPQPCSTSSPQFSPAALGSSALTVSSSTISQTPYQSPASTSKLASGSSVLLTPHDILTDHFSLQDESSSLSVTVDKAVSSTKLPYTAIATIWKKASLLITEKNSVVPAPGYGPQDKMVKSKSGSLPHLVKVSKCRLGVQYQCDQNCPQFQSVHICSNSVAAAESNKELPQFLQYFSSNFQKSSLNLMEVVSSGMPAGAGRKGS